MKQQAKKGDSCKRGCWKNFCVIFFCRKNLFRDATILSVLIIILGTFLGNYILENRKAKEARIQAAEKAAQMLLAEQASIEKEQADIPVIQSEIDTAAWAKYQNKFYGFVLKYPNGWSEPVAQKPAAHDNWEQKVSFRMKQSDESNPFEGFDVEVYSVQKAKEFSNTDEFPKLKNPELASGNECSNITGHLLETGDYPAEEVYIPLNDACFNPTLFFSNTRENYFYNIFPKIKNDEGFSGDPAQEIIDHLPEFFSVIANWDLIDIQRPKPAPPKPVITAPKPVSFKVVNGRLVCAKSNDKPGKSTKGKGRHLDMECCLDPDEDPNPWCYYPPEKYGKFL